MKKIKNTRGSIASIAVIVGMVVITLGIVAGGQLIEKGSDYLSKASESSSEGIEINTQGTSTSSDVPIGLNRNDRSTNKCTYYVAGTGNDSNNGSSGSPWRSISHGIDRMSAGDVLCVGAGDFTDNIVLTTSDSGKTIISLNASVNAHMVAKTADIPLFDINGAKNIIIEGLNLDYGDLRKPNRSKHGWIRITGANTISIRNNAFRVKPADLPSRNTTNRAFMDRAIIPKSSTNLLIEHNYIEGVQQGITSSDLGGDKVIIRNNHITDTWTSGLHIGSPGPTAYQNILIEHNIIEKSKVEDGIQFTQRFYCAEPNSPSNCEALELADLSNLGTIVRNNIIRNNAENAIDLKGAGEIVIEGNIIYGTEGDNDGWYKCGGSACYNGGNDRNSLNAIGRGANANARDIIIRNNVIYDNSAGVHFREIKGMKMYNNTFINNNHDFSGSNNASNWSPASSTSGFSAIKGTATVDLVIKNNIIARHDHGEMDLNTNLGGAQIDGNIYWNGGSNGTGVKIRKSGNLIPYTTWKSGLPGSLENNSRVADPGLANIPGSFEPVTGGNYDFSLKSGSPAINSAVPLTRITGGSGRNIILADSRLFRDGRGVTSGDTIRIWSGQGRSDAVGITNINYSNNTVTVNRDISWQQGDNVNLDFTGSKPDIGAYEYGLATAPDDTSVTSGVEAPTATPTTVPEARILTNTPSPVSDQISGIIRYVSPSGSGNGSKSSPWSLAQANSNLQPGETALLAAGNYTTPINPSRSGTAPNRIIYKATPGATVTFNDISYPLYINNKSYITIDGIKANNVSHFGNVVGGSHNTITNSTFTNSKFSENNRTQYDGLFVDNSPYFSMTNNRMHGHGYVTSADPKKSDNGNLFGLKRSPHVLIENNHLSGGGHAAMIAKGVDDSVIRNNYFHNEEWMTAPKPKPSFVYCDATTNKCGNRDATINGERVLVEGNRFGQTGIPSDVGYSDGIQYTARNTIVRYNAFYKAKGSGIKLVAYNVYPDGSDNTMIYNNVFWSNGYDVNEADSRVGTSSNPSNRAGVNLKISGEYNITGVEIKNNIFYQNIRNIDTHSRASYTANANLITGNPLFSNLSLPDFSIQSGSPARENGTSLSVTTNNGENSTLLRVKNALYFSDGKGLVNADWIKIGGAQPVEIRSVDYATNTITLAQARTWSLSADVFLYKDSTGRVVLVGNKPDLGLDEYGSEGTPTSAPTEPPVGLPTNMPTIAPTVRILTLTPTPGTTSVQFEAEAMQVSSPFRSFGTFISQEVQTTGNTTEGGQARYLFTVNQGGSYVVKMKVRATSGARNSLFYNIDAAPNLENVWHTPVTADFREYTAGWQIGSDINPPPPKYFCLTQGMHVINIAGREYRTDIDAVTIERVAVCSSPTNTPSPTPTNTPTPTFTPSPTSTNTPTPTATPTPKPIQIAAQAEEMSLSGTMKIGKSGGVTYIYSTSSYSSPSSAGQALYRFSTSKGGSYRITFRIRTNGEANNSFFMRVNNSPFSTLHVPNRNGWQTYVTTISLNQGFNNLVIRGREYDTQIDQFVIEQL